MNYPGGKGGVFQKIINLMPPHEVYIESHLGGGAVIRNKRVARRNVGIEIDPEVVGVWKKMSPVGFELAQDDAINYLKKYHFTGTELVYCDPPYLRETRKKDERLYRFDYSREQHRELLSLAVRKKGEPSENWRSLFFDFLDTRLDKILEEYSMEDLGEISKAVFQERAEILGRLLLGLIERKFGYLLNQQKCECPQCGKSMQSQGKQSRHIQTLAGQSPKALIGALFLLQSVSFGILSIR